MSWRPVAAFGGIVIIVVVIMIHGLAADFDGSRMHNPNTAEAARGTDRAGQPNAKRKVRQTIEDADGADSSSEDASGEGE